VKSVRCLPNRIRKGTAGIGVSEFENNKKNGFIF